MIRRHLRTLRHFNQLRELDRSGNRADLEELRDRLQWALRRVEHRLAELPGRHAA
jgi:hypothetical protein